MQGVQASCKTLTGAGANIAGLGQPGEHDPAGKQRRHRAKGDHSDALDKSACSHGSGARSGSQDSGIAFSRSDSMRGMGGVLSSVGAASKAVVSGGQAAMHAAAPGIAIGATERLARASQGAMGCAQAAMTQGAQATVTSKTVFGEAAKASSRGFSEALVVTTGVSSLNTGTAAPQMQRHGSRHGSRHSTRHHTSSVDGSSAPSNRRGGGSRRNGEHSDYASDASGASSRGGRSRNGGRSGKDNGPMDPKEKEQRRARRALRKFNSAFRFENGHEPMTDEEWHPMRRTRVLVREANANFPASTSPSRRRGYGTSSSGRNPASSSTVAAPLKAILALNRIRNPKAHATAEPQEVPVLKQAPTGLRASMRVLLTKPAVEMGVLLSVVMYGMFVFFDLGVGLLAADWWRLTWAKVIDSAFLLFFVIELTAKLVAFGPKYVTESPLNMVDAIAIILCASLFILSDVADALTIDKVAPPIEDSDGSIEGLAQSDQLSTVEDAKRAQKIAGIILVLRLARVVRLAAVLVRTMNMSTKLNMASPGATLSLSGLKEAIDANLSGWRGSIVARKWEKVRREESAKSDVDDTHLAEETASFLCSPANQDVIGLLTGNFQTLINVFQKLDHTRDGSLDRSEFIPGMIGLGLSPETSESFFLALDVDGTGGVEVAELFRAGAFLRGGGAKKLVGPAAVKLGNLPGSNGIAGASAPASSTTPAPKTAQQGIAEIGVVGVAEKHLLKLNDCKSKLTMGFSWWTKERWDPSYELRATLRYLKPTKMADAKVRIRMAPPYIFKAGPVEVHSPPPPQTQPVSIPSSQSLHPPSPSLPDTRPLQWEWRHAGDAHPTADDTVRSDAG